MFQYFSVREKQSKKSSKTSKVLNFFSEVSISYIWIKLQVKRLK